MMGRTKVIEVVLISCEGGGMAGSIISVAAGAVTNKASIMSYITNHEYTLYYTGVAHCRRIQLH